MMRLLSALAGLERSHEVQCLRRRDGFNCEHVTRVLYDTLQLNSRRHTHRYVVFFIARCRNRIHRRRMRQYFVLAHQCCRRDLWHHEPRVQSSSWREEWRQALVQCGIYEALDSALGNSCEGAQRDRQEIEGEGQGFAVEISSGEDFGCAACGAVLRRTAVDGRSHMGRPHML